MGSEPTEWATVSGCRPFHGLDGPPNLTWGCGLRLHPRLYSDARSAGLKIPKYLGYRLLSPNRPRPKSPQIKADIASLAAIKRSVMLKDFLKLIEYEIKR